MNAYTAGPWYVCKELHAPNRSAAIVTGEYVVADTTCLPNFEANARLIAAAPCLLEALKGAVNVWSNYRIDSTETERNALQKCIAAIARAQS